MNARKVGEGREEEDSACNRLAIELLGYTSRSQYTLIVTEDAVRLGLATDTTLNCAFCSSLGTAMYRKVLVGSVVKP